MQDISRRQFMAGAGAAALAAGAGAVAAQAAEAPASEADGVEWTDEADLVIIGLGGAGLGAAAAMGMEGLGSCLMLEAAPEEEQGGNTRVAGQFLFYADSVDHALAYQKKMNEPYTVDDDIMQAWAEGMVENIEWFKGLGADFSDESYFTGAEFSEFAESEGCGCVRNGGVIDDEALWQLAKAEVDKYSFPVYYNARALHLVRNADGEVVGVTCEDGRSFKADKAVVLACGGFEHDPELMAQNRPAGFNLTSGRGSWWDVGDGIRMAQEVGAQLWHMNNFSGTSFGVRMLSPDDDSAVGRIGPTGANWIYLDKHGERFMNEDYFSRQKHGKLWRNGQWLDVDVADGCFCLMGQDAFDNKTIFSHNNFAPHVREDTVLTNEDALAKGIIVKCDTVAELAEQMGVEESVVQTTLDTYNGFAADNYDPQFYRGQDLNTYGQPIAWPGHENDPVKVNAYDLVPIEAPYYLVPTIPVVINSQGGPRRDAQCRVIGLDGEPIPRLYEAGECGCVYPYLYNTGGNVGEAFASGRIAARNASKLDPVA